MAYSAQPSGILARIIKRVQTLANEPETDAKYTPELFWPFIKAGVEHATRELNAMGDHPIIVRFTVSVTPGVQNYYLPCNIGQILRWGFMDAQTHLMRDWVVPRSNLNPAGCGVSFEGNMMHVGQLPTQTESVVVEYIPNGECIIHYGTVTEASFADSSTMTLDTSPNEGYFDQRPNAPLGSIVRLLSGPTPTGYSFFPVQERYVTGYDSTDGTITVTPAFDVDFSGEAGTYTYELIPVLLPQFIDAIAWDITGQFAGIAESYNKASYAERQFSRIMRDLRLSNAKTDGRRGSLIHNDISGVQDAWIY